MRPDRDRETRIMPIAEHVQATAILIRLAVALMINSRNAVIQDPEQIHEAWSTAMSLRSLGQKIDRLQTVRLRGIDPRVIEDLFEKAHVYAQHFNEPHPEHYLMCACDVADDLRAVTISLFKGAQDAA